MKTINDLPDELICKIGFFLDSNDIANFTYFSERTNRSLNQPYFWMALLKRDYPHVILPEDEADYKEQYQKLKELDKNLKSILMAIDFLNQKIYFSRFQNIDAVNLIRVEFGQLPAQISIDALTQFRDKARRAILADNIKTNDGMVPLTAAVRKEKIEIVAALIDVGADVNVHAYEGQNPHVNDDKKPISPLSWSVLKKNISIIKLLIKAGAKVNIVDPYGDRPLLAVEGNFEIAKILIEAGAKPDLSDKYGNTPLYLAAKEGWTEHVKAFIVAGADPKALNSSGVSVVDTLKLDDDTASGTKAEILTLFKQANAYVRVKQELVEKKNSRGLPTIWS